MLTGSVPGGKVGDPVRVRLVSLDVERGFIDFTRI